MVARARPALRPAARAGAPGARVRRAATRWVSARRASQRARSPWAWARRVESTSTARDARALEAPEPRGGRGQLALAGPSGGRCARAAPRGPVPRRDASPPPAARWPAGTRRRSCRMACQKSAAAHETATQRTAGGRSSRGTLATRARRRHACMASCGVRTYPTGPTVDALAHRFGPAGPAPPRVSGDALRHYRCLPCRGRSACAEPGEQLGTLVEVRRTERFRIAALAPPPPRPPGCSSSARRPPASVGSSAIRRRRAGVQGPDGPALSLKKTASVTSLAPRLDAQALPAVDGQRVEG